MLILLAVGPPRHLLEDARCTRPAFEFEAPSSKGVDAAPVIRALQQLTSAGCAAVG